MPKKKNKKSHYEYSYYEISVSNSDFIYDFINMIKEEYKISDKKMNEIYSNAVNKYEEEHQS